MKDALESGLVGRADDARWTILIYTGMKDGFFEARALVGPPERMKGPLIFPDFTTEWESSRSLTMAISYALAEVSRELARRMA